MAMQADPELPAWVMLGLVIMWCFVWCFVWSSPRRRKRR